MDSREIVAQRAIDEFQSRFGAKPASVGVSPGRVNLIGEHTDYNGGFVLPAAVPYYTAVAYAPREDGGLRVASQLFDALYEAPADMTEARGGFGDYLVGMARVLEHHGGFDAAVASTLPMSAGMSSSAALLLATCKGIQALMIQECAPSCMENARAARRAENDFIGVPCGLMDQFIVACAQEGTVSLLDCLDETWMGTVADLPGARWAVIYSGIRRELSGGDYGAKVVASRNALLRVVGATGLPVGALRVLAPESLERACRGCDLAPEELKLLKHFVTENVRVLAMKAALEAGAAAEAGEILSSGHWSLSQDFGVSLPAIDEFVRTAEAVPGVLGVRITGAGFGGSLLALVSGDGAISGLEAAATKTLPPAHEILDVPGFCAGATGWKL